MRLVIDASGWRSTLPKSISFTVPHPGQFAHQVMHVHPMSLLDLSRRCQGNRSTVGNSNSRAPQACKCQPAAFFVATDHDETRRKNLSSLARRHAVCVRGSSGSPSSHCLARWALVLDDVRAGRRTARSESFPPDALKLIQPGTIGAIEGFWCCRRLARLRRGGRQAPRPRWQGFYTMRARYGALGGALGRPASREETSVLGKPHGPRTELRMSPEQTIAAVEAGGLKLERIEEVPPYHYTAIFRNIT